jgi:four helix bundle protein
VVRYLHTKDNVARSLGDQILRAGNSAGANYQEADDGSSLADTRAKRRISLRELKEVLFRLRVVQATGYLGPEYDELIQETLELKRIMASLVTSSASRTPKTGPTP